jgi:mannose-6-phosphate isomerase-like protein (cupin superfamily)/2'-5' RNA ligase
MNGIQSADYLDKKQQESGNVTYIYSDKHVRARNRKKLRTLLRLARTIEKLRRKVAEDLDSPERGEAAMVVALIDETYERVGNPGSAVDGHFGVTTWRKKHVSFSGSKAVIKYKGKAGVGQKKIVMSKRLVSLLKGLLAEKKADDELFPEVTSGMVNEYLRPFRITAKDIRGFHANEEMKKALRKAKGKGGDEKQRKEEFKKALEETARIVGHDPGTLKKDYLVPSFEENYLEHGRIGAGSSSASDMENRRMTRRTRAAGHPDRMLAIRKLAGKDEKKKKKKWEHDSAMLALMAPPGIVRKLKRFVDADSVSPDGLHMTLLFLGKVADLGGEAMKAIQRAAEKVCARHHPLEMRISGAGMFAPGEDGTPVYVVPNAKGLSALQADLENTIGSIIDLPSEHGWVPHMTVAYSCDDRPSPPALEEYPEWTAKTIRFQAGGREVADMPLGVRKKAAPDGGVSEKERPYVGPLEKQTEKNDSFRRVIATGQHLQLVLQSLKGGEDVGEEVHARTDQFFRVDEGSAVVMLDGEEHRAADGGGILVPAGTRHNILNASATEPLKFYTVYGPPHHPPGTVHDTKEDAEKDEKREKSWQKEHHSAGFIGRMIRMAESLDDGGDHESAERLCRQLDLLISRRAHFVPSDKTEAPPMWRENLDYGEDSPYFGSVKEFMKRHPGGLGEYIRKRRKSRKKRERQWKLADAAGAFGARSSAVEDDMEDSLLPETPRSRFDRLLDLSQRTDDDFEEAAKDGRAPDPMKAPREFVRYWSLLLRKNRKNRTGKERK